MGASDVRKIITKEAQRIYSDSGTEFTSMTVPRTEVGERFHTSDSISGKPPGLEPSDKMNQMHSPTNRAEAQGRARVEATTMEAFHPDLGVVRVQGVPRRLLDEHRAEKDQKSSQ